MNISFFPEFPVHTRIAGAQVLKFLGAFFSLDRLDNKHATCPYPVKERRDNVNSLAIFASAPEPNRQALIECIVKITKRFCSICIFVFLLTTCKSNTSFGIDITQEASKMDDTPTLVIEDRSGCVVSSVPGEFSFDPFYEKYCSADGIPIISSGEVDDLALQQAYYIVMNMLVAVPDIRQELVSQDAYFAVIGKNERLTSLPEYASMDSEYWDQRARGLGGGINFPITSSAEENLLCLHSDHRYYGESVAVHEFAHTISLLGLGPDFDDLLKEFSGIYESAIAQGLWENTYAGSNIQEYWAEGVQSYFNANAQSARGDGVHNYVNTREELAEYDPALYAFISRMFNHFEWTPTCPYEK